MKWWDQTHGWGGWEDYGPYGSRFGRFKERVSPADEKTTVLRVAKGLVERHEKPEALPPIFQAPEAVRGAAAIDAYGRACGDLATYPDFGMCHGENPQWTMRKCSAVYLHRAADAKLFPDTVSDHLGSAAAEYFSAYHSWAVAFHQISWGGPKEGGKNKEHRLAASRAILNALQHEKNAIAELKKALAAVREAGD